MFVKKNKSFVPFWLILWSIMMALLPVTALQPTNQSGVERKYKVICYHTNWSQYRQKPARFYPYNIDPNICTHIIYSFAKIDYRGQLAPLEWNDIDYPHMYRQFTNLKKKNPSLRTLLAVGGWNHGSRPFTDMVKSQESRRYFIDHTIQYLRAHRFDGLDLDWEYPANRGSPPEDKARFVHLVRELREAFEDEAKEKNRERLLLSAAVGCGFKIIDSAYDVKSLASHFDFINLMTYDLHGSWEKTLGIHAALYPRKEEIGTAAGKLTVDWAVRRFMELGAPSEKLIMGIPLYGRSFKLCGNDVKPGSKACGAGRRGPFTKEKGFLAYYEVVRSFQDGWVREWDNEHMAPYAYSTKEKQWVGYDDMESIYHKAMYVKSHKLGGAMVWALDLDDFANIATEGMNYPLMRTINDVLWDDFLLPHSPIPQQISTLETIIKLNRTLASSSHLTRVHLTTPSSTKIHTSSPTNKRLPSITPSTTEMSTKSPRYRVTSRRNPYTPPKPRKTKKISTSSILPEKSPRFTTPSTRHTPVTNKKSTFESTTETQEKTKRKLTHITVTTLATKRKPVTRIPIPPQKTSRITDTRSPPTTANIHIKVSEKSGRQSTEKSSRQEGSPISKTEANKSSEPTKQTDDWLITTSVPTRKNYHQDKVITTERTRQPTTLKQFTTVKHILPSTWNWWYRSRKTKRVPLPTRAASTTKTTTTFTTTPSPTTKLSTPSTTTSPSPITTSTTTSTTNRPTKAQGLTLATIRYRNKTLDYQIQNKPDHKHNTTTPCIIIQVQEKVEPRPIFERIRPPKRPPTSKSPILPHDKPSDFTCPTIFGIYADPKDCVSFYQCVWFVPFHYSCGPGTAWNDPLKVCDWPERVNCVVL